MSLCKPEFLPYSLLHSCYLITLLSKRANSWYGKLGFFDGNTSYMRTNSSTLTSCVVLEDGELAELFKRGHTETEKRQNSQRTTKDLTKSRWRSTLLRILTNLNLRGKKVTWDPVYSVVTPPSLWKRIYLSTPLCILTRLPACYCSYFHEAKCL